MTNLIACFQFLSMILSMTSEQGTPANIKLSRPGCYHADEFDVNPKASWFGIFKKENSEEYEIRKVVPLLRHCHDPIFDTEEDSLSGREIYMKESEDNPTIMISGIELKEGNMMICYLNNPRCIYPGDYIKFVLNGKEYALMAKGTVQFDTAGKQLVPYIKDYKVLLVENMYQNPVAQEIISFDMLYAGEEVQPSVFFAGDIDRDGKPDLLYDLSDHYNVSDIGLFLSSEAEKGKHVKEVARWKTTGC